MELTGYRRLFAGVREAQELTDGGIYQEFSHGRLVFNQLTNLAYWVYGDILVRYLAEGPGGPASALGLPTSDEYDAGESRRRNDFQHGYIWWSAVSGANVAY